MFIKKPSDKKTPTRKISQNDLMNMTIMKTEDPRTNAKCGVLLKGKVLLNFKTYLLITAAQLKRCIAAVLQCVIVLQLLTYFKKMYNISPFCDTTGN